MVLVWLFTWFYKLFISPFLPKACGFYPTCSTYMLIAIKKFKYYGVILGIKRILRCNGGKNARGIDLVPINVKGDAKWLI